MNTNNTEIELNLERFKEMLNGCETLKNVMNDESFKNFTPLKVKPYASLILELY